VPAAAAPSCRSGWLGGKAGEEVREGARSAGLSSVAVSPPWATGTRHLRVGKLQDCAAQ
jgi:hypothetical protein